MRRPVIGVMGAAKPGATSLAAAGELGRMIAERGWILLTGGRPVGVMAAASAGAKQVPGSLTVGILPSTGGGEGSDVDVAVFTGMGEARNVINVLSSDVVVACGLESAGTLSEVALALKAMKPVIVLGSSVAAWNFLSELPGASGLFPAATPADVMQILEDTLGITPRPWQDR